jgi:hypothetical protein
MRLRETYVPFDAARFVIRNHICCIVSVFLFCFHGTWYLVVCHIFYWVAGRVIWLGDRQRSGSNANWWLEDIQGV